jgi:DNA polymerase-3 subunit beta
MKVLTLQENLSKGLSLVSRVVSSRVQLPILSNILLSTDRGRLKLSATNLETGINYWLGAKIEKEGAFSVPAKTLTEFISLLPPEKVQLEVKENNLRITSGSYSANLVGLPASEFPIVPSLKEEKIFSFSSEEFLKGISQTIFAASQDEGRPILTGVLFQLKNENLVLVATDGYRLSFRKMRASKSLKEIKEFQKGLIIPSRALAEVEKIISSSQQKEEIGLAIASSSNQIIFATPEAEIVSRLIEGSFPEFEKIIPEKWITKIVLEKESFLRAVRTASIFARESANIVKFKVQKSKLKISANAPQVGDNLIELETKQEGEENSIAFNSRFILDFLNSTEANEISFEMTSPLNPGIFRPGGDSSYFHIIMPVRVQE